MEALFLAYGIYFFVILVLLALTVISHFDSLLFALGTFIISVVVAIFVFKLNFAILLAFPWYAYLVVAPSYLTIGIFWSMQKFKSLYRKEVIRLRKSWESNYLPYTHHKDTTWEIFLDSHTPKVSQFKQAITYSIMLWPPSIVEYICTNFIFDLLNSIYEFCYDYYQAIANNIIAKFKVKYATITDTTKENNS